MQKIEKWWPTILPILLAAFTAAVPALQQAISAHPAAGAAIAAIGWVMAHLMKSPLAAK